MASTGYQLRDIGRGLGWQAAEAAIRHAAPDSAIMWELQPEIAAWSTTLKTNLILADIADRLGLINANLVAIGTGRPARAVKPYPRPGGAEKRPEEETHIGSGALPPDELKKWFEAKRRERKCRK